MTLAKWGLFILLIASVPVVEAHPQQTQSPDQDDSLAAAARRAREQKKQQAAPVKVWTNDDIPKNSDGISVIGQPPASADSGKPANAESAAKGASDSTAGAPKPAAEAAKKEADATDLAAAKDQLQTLQADLDILQRKYTLDKQTYYGKPDYSSDTAGAAALSDEQDQIDAKQAEITDAQKKIEELQQKEGTASDTTSPPETPESPQ